MFIAPPCLVDAFADIAFVASATARVADAEHARGSGKLSRSTTTPFDSHGIQGEHAS
jgi:hypothetical protein